jgi:hypothetical protein
MSMVPILMSPWNLTALQMIVDDNDEHGGGDGDGDDHDGFHQRPLLTYVGEEEDTTSSRANHQGGGAGGGHGRRLFMEEFFSFSQNPSHVMSHFSLSLEDKVIISSSSSGYCADGNHHQRMPIPQKTTRIQPLAEQEEDPDPYPEDKKDSEAPNGSGALHTIRPPRRISQDQKDTILKNDNPNADNHNKNSSSPTEEELELEALNRYVLSRGRKRYRPQTKLCHPSNRAVPTELAFWTITVSVEC